MSQKDGFIDSLKHMVFEDEPEQQKPTTASINASAATAATMAPIFSQTTASVPDNDEAYHRILSKTDFDATEAGATIQKFLQPLANLPMDAALKFKTAVAQAKAQNGLTEEKIISALDGLKATLRKEQDAFA